MDFCKNFAQGVRTYVLLAGMGLGIEFTHIPPIYICKQVLFFFFLNKTFLFSNSKNTSQMTCLWGPVHSTHRFRSSQTAVNTAWLRG